jgi:hypothetical protein
VCADGFHEAGLPGRFEKSEGNTHESDSTGWATAQEGVQAACRPLSS